MVGVRVVELGIARNQEGKTKEWMAPWMGFVSMTNSFMDFVCCTVVADAQLREVENAVSPTQNGEVLEIVSKFCGGYSGTKIEPTQRELDHLWVSCMQIPSCAVVSALHDQLTWGKGGWDWQPKLRVLCAIEHFRRAGGTARDVANTVVDEARGLLQYLVSDVPQCSPQAARILAEVKPEETLTATSVKKTEPPLSAVGSAVWKDLHRVPTPQHHSEAFAGRVAGELLAVAVNDDPAVDFVVEMPAALPAVQETAVAPTSGSTPASGTERTVNPLISAAFRPLLHATPETQKTKSAVGRRATTEQLRFLPLSAVDAVIETSVDPFAFVNEHVKRV